MKILSPQRFPMHDGQTITVLTHKNIPSKIENKRQSVKIENPRSSWTMALSRSIITQAIHHQPPIKAKYNNYLVLRGRAPPRYVSSAHVRTVSKLRSNKKPSNRGRNDTAAPCPAPLSPWPHPPPVTPLQLCPQLPVVTCPPKQFSI